MPVLILLALLARDGMARDVSILLVLLVLTIMDLSASVLIQKINVNLGSISMESNAYILKILAQEEQDGMAKVVNLLETAL